MQPTNTAEARLNDQARLVNGILRGMRRRGLPANVDVDDLRQEGIIALFGQDGPAKLQAKIAKNAMVYALRGRLRDNARYYTGVARVSGAVVNSAGDTTGQKSQRATDPFFVLDIDGLESRHNEWERERSERWA